MILKIVVGIPAFNEEENIILDDTEPTSRFVGEILKKISNSKNYGINSQLHKVLQNNKLFL